jgi:hypothetical protein
MKSHLSLIAAFLIASSLALNEDFSGGEEHPASNNKIDKYRILSPIYRLLHMVHNKRPCGWNSVGAMIPPVQMLCRFDDHNREAM